MSQHETKMMADQIEDKNTPSAKDLPAEYFLTANPGFYDYIHNIRLHKNGVAELSDGGGQSINFLGRGKYTLELEETRGKIMFTEFYSLNPYARGNLESRVKLEDFEVCFTVEKGDWYELHERVWGIKSPYAYG